MLKDPAQEEKKKKSNRVCRGGGWLNRAIFLVVSNRYSRSPGARSHNLGFRPVRNLKEKE